MGGPLTLADPAIPTIEIGRFEDGTQDDKRAVARQVAAACEDTGFFLIANHAVPEALIARTRQAAVDFFAQPLEDKLKVERPPSKISRGYNPLGDRSLSYSLGVAAPPDLQEAWAMGPIETRDAPYYKDGPAETFFAPNRWPDAVPGFRETLTEYYAVLSSLSATVMRVFALALDLDEDFFADKINKPCSNIRLIRYPAQDHQPDADQLRAGAHTDYGTLTILHGDDVPGGLQVRLRDGAWIDVAAPPGGFVCNIGDAMMRWTNDRWVSTLHRVANPPGGAAHGDRISLVFFHLPNHDAVLGGIESCRGPGGADAYPPITFAEHYLSKVMKAAHQRLDARLGDLAAE